MNNKIVYLLITFACLGNLFAQEKQTVVIRDTLYVTDTIQHIHTYGTAGLGARLPDFYCVKTNNTLSVSIGSADIFDTYLSPLNYKGTSLRVNYEQMRHTRWFNSNFLKQQVFDLELSKANNPSGNASEYAVLFNYRLGGHYKIISDKNLRIGLGTLWDTSLGVLYSERNGNNPASARAYSNIDLSAIASYKFKKFVFRWQVDAAVVGVLFSPHYGQSYYEISLGNSVGLVNLASFHNQRAMRNYFTTDFAWGSYIIRVGYLGNYYQTKIHDLQTHHYTHHIVLGLPMESVKTKRSKAKNGYWD